jgi:hypothetical protein
MSSLVYYGMVKPLTIMLGKVPGEIGNALNIMGKDESIP